MTEKKKSYEEMSEEEKKLAREEAEKKGKLAEFLTNTVEYEKDMGLSKELYEF